jgi:DNA helicase-2/ATP-dependent DNA helicase PcrA
LPHIFTLHSLSFEIIQQSLRSIGLRKDGLRVQEDEDVKRLLYRDASLVLGFSNEDANVAQRCKQQGACQEGSKVKECAICSKYREIMSKCNCVDFDDQILFACKVLENDTNILKEYQERALYLLVDEYQDINAAQFRLIELLSRNSRNGLFVVGDDAQSIHSFRGADPTFILNFEKNFTDATKFPLAHSRRCHENIMNDAVKVLKQFYHMWTGPFELDYHVTIGEPPRILQLPSEKAEAKMVANITQEAVEGNNTVLVLAPKKEFFPLISKALNQRGVPHICPVNLLPEAVDRRLHVIVNILKWVENPSDNFLTRIVVENLLDFGEAKVPGAAKDGRSNPETIEHRIKTEQEIATLWEGVNKETRLRVAIASHALSSVIVGTLHKTLNELEETFASSSGKHHGEFAKTLALAGGVWGNPSNLANDLCAVSELMNTPCPTGSCSVQLMTMRKAKGLEADVVIMVGLEDDVIPAPNSDLEEQARLFYVSMTRATKQLYLLHAFKRPRNISYGQKLTSKKRSRFLDAIGRPSEYIPLRTHSNGSSPVD